jgi:hypothetical protein
VKAGFTRYYEPIRWPIRTFPGGAAYACMEYPLISGGLLKDGRTWFFSLSGFWL